MRAAASCAGFLLYLCLMVSILSTPGRQSLQTLVVVGHFSKSVNGTDSPIPAVPRAVSVPRKRRRRLRRSRNPAKPLNCLSWDSRADLAESGRRNGTPNPVYICATYAYMCWGLQYGFGSTHLHNPHRGSGRGPGIGASASHVHTCAKCQACARTHVRARSRAPAHLRTREACRQHI